MENWTGRDRLALFSILLFIGELVLFIGVSAIPIQNSALVNSLQSERDQIASQPYLLQLFSIFYHNFEIALIEFIPGLGVAFLIFSISGTAIALSALSNSQGIPGWAAAMFLMTLPHSWLELPAYAIAAASGLYLIISLARKGENIGSVYRFFAMIGFVAVELFFAASVEAAEIVVENVNPVYSYLFWFPAIPLIYALFVLFNYIQQKTEG